MTSRLCADLALVGGPVTTVPLAVVQFLPFCHTSDALLGTTTALKFTVEDVVSVLPLLSNLEPPSIMNTSNTAQGDRAVLFLRALVCISLKVVSISESDSSLLVMAQASFGHRLDNLPVLLALEEVGVLGVGPGLSSLVSFAVSADAAVVGELYVSITTEVAEELIAVFLEGLPDWHLSLIIGEAAKRFQFSPSALVIELSTCYHCAFIEPLGGLTVARGPTPGSSRAASQRRNRKGSE